MPFVFPSGINFFLRKIIQTIDTTEELKKLGENLYEFATESKIKSQYLKFKENEEFVEETLEGTKVKTLIYFENGKVIQIQCGLNGEKDNLTLRTEREYIEDEMICTYYLGDFVARRFFKAV